MCGCEFAWYHGPIGEKSVTGRSQKRCNRLPFSCAAFVILPFRTWCPLCSRVSVRVAHAALALLQWCCVHCCGVVVVCSVSAAAVCDRCWCVIVVNYVASWSYLTTHVTMLCCCSTVVRVLVSRTICAVLRSTAAALLSLEAVSCSVNGAVGW